MTAPEQLGQVQSVETPKPAQRTVEQIQAEIDALDPWGDDAKKIDTLEVEKANLLKIQAQAVETRERERVATARLAEEKSVEDEVKAAALVENIKRGKIGGGEKIEINQKIPSDTEIERMYMGTVEYDSDGRVISSEPNIRLSRSAMLKILTKNIENVAFVPPSLLRQDDFQSLLQEQYRVYRPGGSFETFYKLVSDPRYGLNKGEASWQEKSPDELAKIIARTQREADETAAVSMGSKGFDLAFSQALETMEKLEKA